MTDEREKMPFKDANSMGLTRTNAGNVKLRGHVYTELRDKDGNLKHTEMSNLIPTVGLELFTDLIGPGGTAPSHIALGTGTTTPAAGDTTLVAEITTNGGARAAASLSQPTATTQRFETTFTFTGTLGINETGLLNAASSGTLAARAVYAAVLNVVNGDQLTQRWECTLS